MDTTPKPTETTTPTTNIPVSTPPIVVPQQSQNQLFIPIAIVVAGVLVAGAVIFSGKGATQNSLLGQQMPSQTAPAPSAPQVSADIAKVNLANEPYVGNINAPIVIAIWADYQCPFCKRFDMDSVAGLMNDYVKNGKARLVFKDFPFLGTDSITAGVAARAVWEIAPEKFFAWHEAMYARQDGENSGWGSKDDILALTKSLGIDSAKVESLMTTKGTQYQQAMDADKNEGSDMGVTGTPSIIVGKQLVIGAQPYSTIKAAVEAAIAGK